MAVRSDDERGASARPAQSGERSRLVRRGIILGMLAILAVLFLAGCGPEVDKPYSTTSPASPGAEDIHSLYKLVFWLALVVFVGVQFAIVYTALRFRRTRTATQRPAQIHGNSRLEITWTIIPAVVLLIILIPTITTLYDEDAAAQEGDLTIEVNGKQWWWEIIYGENADGDNLGVVTANEIRVPAGKEVIFELKSNNVIHSFWVPRLAGKMDVIPGHENKMSITAEEPGIYYGECAEFCGAQHAWMRFKVIAMPEDDFYSWVNTMRTGNPGTANPDAELPEGVTRAPANFSVCLACHAVNGFDGGVNLTGMEAPKTFGPNLTNLACRETIAAGMLINNPENLKTWLHDPGAVKPENYMATQIRAGMYSDEELDELVDYLTTLQPANGCDGNGESTANSGTPQVVVASPEAAAGDD